MKPLRLNIQFRFIFMNILCSCKSKIRMEEDCTLRSSAASNIPWLPELVPNICEEWSVVICYSFLELFETNVVLVVFWYCNCLEQWKELFSKTNWSNGIEKEDHTSTYYPLYAHNMRFPIIWWLTLLLHWAL
jgi:hypothetical protein